MIGASPAAPSPGNCAGHARAREQTLWPHACDRCRATHRALPACTPSYADYILRLEDTEPESLEIMLRLLIVALPLVVALPAAFDEQEVNALHFEQSPLQFEVRSPPESRPHLPAATQDQHKSRRTLLSARTTPKRTHHNTRAGGTRAKARRSTPRSTSSPTSSSPGTSTHHPQVCLGPAGSHACSARSFRSALPLRARSRDRCACCRRARTRAHAHRPLPRLTHLCARREARRPPRNATCTRHRHEQARAASPVLLTACALLTRCRQPQLRAVGLDGHCALDIFATTGRRNVDITVTMIDPPPVLATGCVADGYGVGLDQDHARGTGSVGAARRRDAHPVRPRAHCHRAQRGRGLIAAPLPGCTPACAHPCM